MEEIAHKNMLTFPKDQTLLQYPCEPGHYPVIQAPPPGIHAIKLVADHGPVESLPVHHHGSLQCSYTFR